MYNAEEMQFLELSSKFRDELSHIDKQIDELEARRNHLLALLYRTDDLDKVEVTQKGTDHTAIVDPDEAFSLPSVLTLPEGEELVPAQKATLDKRVVAYLRRNRGISSKELSERFSSYKLDDVKRSLARNKNRGAVVSEGHGRAAVWYVVE